MLVDARKRFLQRAVGTYIEAKEKDTPEQFAQRMSFLSPYQLKLVHLAALHRAKPAG